MLRISETGREFIDEGEDSLLERLLATLNEIPESTIEPFAWEESKHPRGETSPESTPGSFAPSSSSGTNAHKAAKKIEKSIVGDKKETMVAIDKNGGVLFRKTGGARRVSIDMEEGVKIKAGSLVTHNHPENTTLSNDDFALAAFHDVGEIRAVTKVGTYWARPGKEGWPSAWKGENGRKRIWSELERASLPIRAGYRRKLADGMPLKKAQELILHDVTGRVLKKHGISYGLEK